MQQRIYISGKISNLPYAEVVEKFAAAELKLAAAYPGCAIENPIRITGHLPQTEHWETFMRLCVEALTKCTHIFMLKDWTRSPGAKVELKLAIDLGLTIIFEP